jgi:hypothetical protein
VEQIGYSTATFKRRDRPLFKWTIRFRWKGQTIEIEIEIGLNL